MDAQDKIMNFINCLDTEYMNKNQIRSAIYKKCMELPIAEH